MSALHGLDWSILGPALLAGCVVLATHVPLGMTVLDKGIVFIDLAIAQIAGLGMVLAGALAGALLLSWTEGRWPDVQEALIGVVFVLASCIGLLVLAGSPHGGEQLKALLAGQVLWVTPAALVGGAVLAVLVLAVWFCARGRPGRVGFYLVFALAVTGAVQLVGVYLVFASLIVPALAVRRLPPCRRLPVAYAVGGLGYLLGLALSSVLDWPGGPLVVVAMALVALASRPAHRLFTASSRHRSTLRGS